MTEAQIQLQNSLTTTFLANLAFLSEYDNELYHRVDELSRLIENGKYKEKYALEFNMQDGEFDIYDIINDKYLYNKKPKKINDELVRKIEFDEKNGIFNLEEVFSYKVLFDINYDDRFNFGSAESMALTSNQMQEYKNITKDYLENRKKRLKEIKKFIFLGTLLGRHIPRIANKINAKLYLVLEKNLEIFRLSLFTVDYTVLAKNGVVFSIMDNDLDEEKKIDLFLNIYSYDNYLLKFSTSGINIDNYVSKILGIIASNKPTIYEHNRKLYIHLNRTIQRIKEKYSFPQFNNLMNNLDFFKNIPILYIAAGPSLDENIDWIKDHQHKFYIVSIGAVYKKLLASNIRVDMICTVDEDVILEEIQFNDEIIEKIPEHTIILASTMTHEKVLNKFDKCKVFLFEVYKSLFTNSYPFNGYSIGEITLDILLKLNAKEIYLIGLDLALNQESGESHSKDSNSFREKYDMTKDDDRNSFGLNESLLKVKGNLKNEVVTTAILYISINFLNQNILVNKPKDVNIYNLSNNGAYFRSTIPTQINEININNLIDLSIDYKRLNQIINKYSQNSLENKIRILLNSDIENIRNFINNELDKFEKIQLANFQDFIDKCFDGIKDKLNLLNNELLLVLLNKYYLILLPYLKYYFNEKSIKDERKKINKIKKVFLSQIKVILDDYVKIVEVVTKKESS
ncbi:MAG: DUF115 domain-containing protein [Arcobacter sp.]|jgi:hypothetical protein|uniref:motility associated factor glycosyltransferase family protein n=1 Tax=Arcobacter sp. TaxID=1872629 RepID=UPI002A759D1D|nr:6-hydroxymethylpterin diphosphokinase MptE-like protein [Arcobacter sp.]MDY3203744.1 DUF115 domain-containing protein [Arcobacter sp.]